MRRHHAAVLAAVALAAFAPPAGAETQKAVLGPEKPTFGWNGHGVGLPGFECSNEAIFRCDSVVLTLTVPGDLTLSIDVEGSQITTPVEVGSYPNFDLYLFASDAEGTKQGEAVAEATTPIDDEKLEARALAAGHYLLEVRSNESIGEDYTGKAKLSNFPVPAAPPAPGAPAAAPPAAGPGEAQRPKRSSRARCRAKARKIKSKRKRAAAMRRCNRRAG